MSKSNEKINKNIESAQNLNFFKTKILPYWGVVGKSAMGLCVFFFESGFLAVKVCVSVCNVAFSLLLALSRLRPVNSVDRLVSNCENRKQTGKEGKDKERDNTSLFELFRDFDQLITNDQNLKKSNKI